MGEYTDCSEYTEPQLAALREQRDRAWAEIERLTDIEARIAEADSDRVSAAYTAFIDTYERMGELDVPAAEIVRAVLGLPRTEVGR